MKNILIPIDFSENSTSAIRYALNFSENDEVNINLLHIIDNVVIDYPQGILIDTKAIEVLQHQATKNMELLIQKLESKYKASFSSKILTGNVVSVITNYTKQSNPDLIIMGTKGQHHDRTEKLFGTISTAIANNPPCPVLVIPQSYEYEPIDVLVFATDLQKDDSFILWKALKTLAPHSPLTYCINIAKNSTGLHSEKAEIFKEYLKESSSSISLKFDVQYAKSENDGIYNYAVKNRAKVILINKSEKGFFEKIFTKNHTSKLIHKVEIPLLII